MDIKGFKAKDGTVHKYDYDALANRPGTPEGGQGADGGYYTPAVTQPEENVLQFDFTPSKADMPAVEPVQVKLPAPDSGGNVDLHIGPDKPTNGATYWLDTSEDEVVVVLTGISAVYSGGDVTVGTAVTDLTGIVVTATYSDGSTETVTDYTLSGMIAEGSNTVTVAYQNMTTTFTVTGIAESGGEEEPDEPEVVTYTITNTLTNVTNSNSATSVEENASYTATLTAADGYELESVTVTMGGVDVTADVYADGVVTIPAVTGAVVIIATAVEESGEESGTVTYNIPAVATEYNENMRFNCGTDSNGNWYEKLDTHTTDSCYKLEGIKAGDVLVAVQTNSDHLGWGKNGDENAEKLTGTKSFKDNYSWCTITWTADKDYDVVMMNVNTTKAAAHSDALTWTTTR